MLGDVSLRSTRLSALPFLETLTKSLKIILMVDSEQQIDLLESYASKASSPVALWPVFIKIDVSSQRAGIATHSPSLPRLIQRMESSSAATVYGFYCHAGHSYACRTEDAAVAVLQTEVEGGSWYRWDQHLPYSTCGEKTAGRITRGDGVRVICCETDIVLLGNYPTNDLQQVATSLVEPTQQAMRILTDVYSVYPDRNEALVNAGIIALSK
ncbi:hypothetical protein N7471_005827 [Penicillium samsonianum]|uniref:uncharacterized protein n=1 Tax=Penicillium samsonianum TaxID=1882272 RepID=UPI00254825FC|nr:uncharacterized protein N7471_005827 [Penicillium samsonianum]KAJ6139341.1 hypothetical protein N7471_005827 [Penicillium samsonianum]